MMSKPAGESHWVRILEVISINNITSIILVNIYVLSTDSFVFLGHLVVILKKCHHCFSIIYLKIILHHSVMIIHIHP